MNDELNRIRRGIAQIARNGLRRAVEARPQGVQFSQGCYDAILRDLPMLIADAAARTVVLEKAHENAIAKVVTLQVQVADLQERLAVIEGRKATPTKDIDAGVVVRLREVASA